MEESKTANAPGRHPRGIQNTPQIVDSALASTLIDSLISVQRTIGEGISSTKIHGGEIDELFFSTAGAGRHGGGRWT